MLYKDFFPHGVASVQLKFECNKCHKMVESDSIGVPSPNFLAEKSSDSYSENYDTAFCECEEEFTISVNAGFADGYIEIEQLDDDTEIEIIEDYEELDEYYEEQIDNILTGNDSIKLFNTEIDNLKRLNDIPISDTDLQITLQRQLFSGAITCLEDYLSSTLITEIMNNDGNFKNFVRTFHKIRDEKFTLNEIYEKLDKLKDIVKKGLLDTIYHHLPKVKGMYEDSLKINFPDIEDLVKDIRKRHDMVHRNGKDKYGNSIDISKLVVDAIIKRVEEFVNKIEPQIKH